MGIGKRIKEAREKAGLTQEQLGGIVGVTGSAITNYEKGTSHPKESVMYALIDALGVDANFLFQDCVKLPSTKKSPSDISEEAHKVAKDYDGLDRHGRNMTRIVITEEQRRMAEEKRRKEIGEGGQRQTKVIPLYYTPAAAGMTSPAAGEDFDYIEVDSGTASWNADFAVKIDGDSMEPYIKDGSTVFVNREPLENGDVGIFYIDGDMICKQYYQDEDGNVHLLSLNRERRDADRFIRCGDNDTGLTCYGRVILPRRPPVNMA